MCDKLLVQTNTLNDIANISASVKFFSQYVVQVRHALNEYRNFARHCDFGDVITGLSDDQVDKILDWLRGSQCYFADHFIHNKLVQRFGGLNIRWTELCRVLLLFMESQRDDRRAIYDNLEKLEHDLKNSLQKLRYYGLYDHKKYYKDKNKKPFIAGYELEYYALCNQLYKQMKVIGWQFIHISLQTQAIWKRYGKT